MASAEIVPGSDPGDSLELGFSRVESLLFDPCRGYLLFAIFRGVNAFFAGLVQA